MGQDGFCQPPIGIYEFFYRDNNMNILRNTLLCFLLLKFSHHASAEEHVIQVETDKLVGKVYNLWNVRVLNSPERWLKNGYAENIQSGSNHIDIIMNVRILGGKINHTCEWFKGVDAAGEPICDFAGLFKIIDAQIGAGFTPWIVLDQVPHAMTSAKPNDIYGIVNPADDMKLWYKYVRKTVSALVGKYGMETVEKWHFRVGTEPNNPQHWADTKEKFFEHYDYTVAAVESVIANPIVGPGNFLMVRDAQSAENKSKNGWTFEILRHCAEGKNFATGQTGTRIAFYCQSCYGITGQRFPFEENMRQYQAELAKYPSLKGLPHEIHEYGEIKSITGRGPAVSSVEWFGGFYAQTADIAYQYGTRRIFNWGGLGGPSGKVVDCLVKMEGGERVAVTKDPSEKVDYGAIVAWKDRTLYAIVYSHDPKLNGTTENTINLSLSGERIAYSPMWKVDQWLFDRDNGVEVREHYKDLAAAGIEPKEGSQELDAMFRKYNLRRDGRKIEAVLEANKVKYKKLSEMKQVRSGEKFTVEDGELKLQVKLKGSGFHFLKLIMVK